MRSAQRIGIALAVVLAMISVASLVWGQQIPSVPQINEIGSGGHYFSQDLVIVLTSDGYYKATNDGWELMSPLGYGGRSVSLGGAIYAYHHPTREIRRSLDGGKIWPLTGTFPLTDTSTFGWLSASPVTSTVFMGVAYTFPETGPVKGIYKSTDGGATWRRTLEGYDAGEIVFSPNFAQDGTAFVTFGGYKVTYGVWKTADGGETWYHSSAGLGVGMSHTGFLLSISPQFALDQTVFAISDFGVYRSTDGGQTWCRVGDLPGYSPNRIAISPNYIHDQTLLTGDYDEGLFLSQDGGISWQRLDFDGSPRHVGIRLQAPFQPWPAPAPPVPPGLYRVYLPLVSAYRREQFEFWVVTNGSLSNPISHLYRSCDMGAAWEEEWVFEASHWLYLPFVAHVSVETD